MKTIYEHAIGSGGAVGGLYIEGGKIVEKVSYPLAGLVDEITKPLESVKAKLEAAIPGGHWADPVIDEIFAAAKAEIVSLLSE